MSSALLLFVKITELCAQRDLFSLFLCSIATPERVFNNGREEGTQHFNLATFPFRLGD